MHKNAYSFGVERNHIRLHTNRVAVVRGVRLCITIFFTTAFMYHRFFGYCKIALENNFKNFRP